MAKRVREKETKFGGKSRKIQMLGPNSKVFENFVMWLLDILLHVYIVESVGTNIWYVS